MSYEKVICIFVMCEYEFVFSPQPGLVINTRFLYC